MATLVLTASLVPAEFARVVEAGAAGFLHKSADTDDIIGAVRRLRDGEAPLSPDEDICMLRAVTADRQKERRARISIESLTPRELQILEALAEGLDSKEIAQRLSITPETERTHMKNLLQKLGANSRLQALVFAARLELVEIRANPQELAEIR